MSLRGAPSFCQCIDGRHRTLTRSQVARSADRTPTPTDATEGATPRAGGGATDPANGSAGGGDDRGISVDALTGKFVFNLDGLETADVDRVEEVESVPWRARMQSTEPGDGMALVATRALRRPTPWLKIALIAGCLCAAAAGWLFHRSQVSDQVETAASPAVQPGDALAEERRRSKELEQQLAARQGDQEALGRERARSEGLEQRLAARQNDQQGQGTMGSGR